MKGFSKLLTGALCIAVMGASVGAFAGCGGKETISVSGSTSVNEIMETLADEYGKTHKNVRINITAHGSSAGIEDTAAGRNDIGMSSKALSQSEIDGGLTGKVLCTDGIVLAVGKNCPVSQVTNDEVYALYINGTAITQEAGTISTGIGRDGSSGTAEAFNEKIVGGEGENRKSIKEAELSYHKSVNKLGGTGLVIDMIKNDKDNRSMGYISMGSYLKNTDTLKALKFQADKQTDYVEATVDNIKNESYKLQRPFVIVTKTDAKMSDTVKEFYDWLWSKEAQAVISENGYVL